MTSTLNAPLTGLPGVGEKLAEKLGKLGIRAPIDLLFHLPLRYEDRTRIIPIANLRTGIAQQVVGEIVKAEIKFARKRMLVVHIEDESGSLVLRWFNFYPNQQKMLTAGKRIVAFGDVRWNSQHFEIVHPEFKLLKPNEAVDVADALTPIYPVGQGVGQTTLRKLIKHSLENFTAGEIDLMLDAICANSAMPNLIESLHTVHSPSPDISFTHVDNMRHRKRLALEELIAHQVGLRLYRHQMQSYSSSALSLNTDIQTKFEKQLGFTMTGAQRRVVAEIAGDMAKTQPMMRLVQGDVGSGKTVVAAMAALVAADAGLQVVVMAPTEILAEQHANAFSAWFSPLGYSTALLLGKSKGEAKKAALGAIASGDASIIVGTHALFQDQVEYHALGLVIIDEQHRFGVAQRNELLQKGMFGNHKPHQLVMTATPIPRTLAMTAYSDLDVSIIDELPPGRLPVKTIAVSLQKREEIIDRIKNVCASGQQVYWVCTLVEESEALLCQAAENTAKVLEETLNDINVGLIHGRMKSTEKEDVMAQFTSGQIKVLVATTVIEVGVNVPNATLMVIENAERFGLAQLHQLRGRVGRAGLQSYCVLLYESPLSADAKERINVMRETTDGFVIAEKDLEIRGAGELLGTRQTGDLRFKIADLQKDEELLDTARNMADQLVQENEAIVDTLMHRWMSERQDCANV